MHWYASVSFIEVADNAWSTYGFKQESFTILLQTVSWKPLRANEQESNVWRGVHFLSHLQASEGDLRV